MAIIVQGITYKSKRAYYETIHPEHVDATQNDIDRYLYHNVPEYHNKKKTFYREKYREKKNNTVRRYEKYNANDKIKPTDMSNEQFNSTFFN